MHIFYFALAAQRVLADSDDGGGWSSIGYLFLLSGVVFYLIMYFRYRNTHQRHRHESETEAKRANETVQDQFLKKKRGLRSSTMSGANHRQVKGSLNKGAGAAEQLLGKAGINMDQLPNTFKKLGD